MKIRFNPETQECEVLIGGEWMAQKPTEDTGEYAAFEVDLAALCRTCGGEGFDSMFTPCPACEGIGTAVEATDERTPVVPSKAYELVTRCTDGDDGRSLHVTEAEATDAALAYVRRELEPLADPDTHASLLDRFNIAVERDGIEDALADVLDQYGPEISYTITEVVLPSHAPSGVPTLAQVQAWTEAYDGIPTEEWLYEVLAGHVTVENFNRAVLTNTAPEGLA